MKRTFATYEHNTVGFPHIKLKWSEANGMAQDFYVTIKGIVHPYKPEHERLGWRLDPKEECEKFDNWVRLMYSDDPSVQG